MIVTSAVGMDVNTSRADLLPAMLARVLAGGPVDDGGRGRDLAAARRDAGPAAGARSPPRSPTALALELTARLELRGLDWATTRAFAHPADNQGYVRLNLRGRERDGIVDAGRGRRALRGDRRRAGDASPIPTGRPAVDEVVRVGRPLPGRSRRTGCPDLAVRWAERPATHADRR